jgi:hypothetical protein
LNRGLLEETAAIALQVQNVDAGHSRFAQWLRRFHGVASR